MSDRPYRLVEWPLWSWRNLAISVTCLLLVVAVIGRVSSALGRSPTPTGASPATVLPSPSAASFSMTEESSATPSVPVEDTGSPPGAGSCVDAATRFVTAWTRRDLPATAWLEGLRPMAAPSFLAQLEQSDPGRVPASRVVGQAAVVRSSDTGDVVKVVTDGGRIDVVTQAGTCLISDLQPAEGVPGAPTPVLSAMTPATATGG